MSQHIVGLLVAERDKLNRAIAALSGEAEPAKLSASERMKRAWITRKGAAKKK